MKVSSIATVAAFLATQAAAAPVAGHSYPEPEGGWENVKYPEGTGENLHEYPAPKGGWENVKYPAGTCSGSGGQQTWTSTYHVVAVGAEVRNGTVPAPGPADAVGYFDFQINSVEDKICYQIKLCNVKGTPQSAAKTATHIHEAARGASGPPRLAFTNPTGDDITRYSEGCLTGPFTTGINGPNGQDTGTGFKVKKIEDNPAGFFTDTHTNLFLLGAVRGQLA
ncbi:hypothetical protein BJ875DRAFT_89681 [Amylocarpus encephaloides]|uniref:CHRD domain-containing protein n=1 Tax=Amylocarpus encephaloides TaxID=45428 RepID=A0A9P7YF37_9HELO|nr:hypothetical protein BJ875DRAFT_89681 [Amylocarpus encephaloides]